MDSAGGEIREGNKKTFPALEGLAIFSLILKPGAVRIPHWHRDANELDYVAQGRDCESSGPGDLHVLVIFNDADPSDIGISVGLGGMSPVVLSETLGAPADGFRKLPLGCTVHRATRRMRWRGYSR
jgi:oxalate decarboxylase/phosphoglucose isomerase-like protein (cupin superfamily)